MLNFRIELFDLRLQPGDLRIEGSGTVRNGIGSLLKESHTEGWSPAEQENEGESQCHQAD